MLSPFRMACRNFILPDFCKPCLFFLRNLLYLIAGRRLSGEFQSFLQLNGCFLFYPSSVPEHTITQGKTLENIRKRSIYRRQDRTLEEPAHRGLASPCTDAFLGRIRCGICGTEYRRVNHAGKLVTWYCYDRKQRRHGCTNRNYPDFVLRQMVAEIMDTDDFDETTFLEQVDHITADPGETITLHFRDGRTAQWQGI